MGSCLIVRMSSSNSGFHEVMIRSSQYTTTRSSRSSIDRVHMSGVDEHWRKPMSSRTSVKLSRSPRLDDPVSHVMDLPLGSVVALHLVLPSLFILNTKLWRVFALGLGRRPSLDRRIISASCARVHVVLGCSWWFCVSTRPSQVLASMNMESVVTSSWHCS